MNLDNDNDCNAVLAELSAYLDGMLPEDRTERIEQHLAKCADCRTERDRLEIVMQELAQLPRSEPSPDLRRRLLAHAEAEVVFERTEVVMVQQGSSRFIHRQIVPAPASPEPAAESSAGSEARTIVSYQSSRESTTTPYRRIIHRP